MPYPADPAEALCAAVRAWRAAETAAGPFGVACSGGLDSTALAWACCRVAAEDGWDGKVVLLHIDHRLRPDDELRAEAAVLLAQAVRWRVALVSHALPDGAVAAEAVRRRRGVEEAASALRRSALTALALRHGLCRVLLAHHADDLLETRIMDFCAGRLPSRTVAEAPLWARPLAGLNRQTISAAAAAVGLMWHEDSTNTDTAFLRNAVRHTVAPALHRVFPGAAAAIESRARFDSWDQECLEALAGALEWRIADGEARLPTEQWERTVPALRWRALRRASWMVLRAAGTGRQPERGFLAAAAVEDGPEEITGAEQIAAESGGWQFGFRTDACFLRRRIVGAHKKGYLVVLTGPCRIDLPDCGAFELSFPGGSAPDVRWTVRNLAAADFADRGRSLAERLREAGVPRGVVESVPVLCRNGLAFRALTSPWIGHDMDIGAANGAPELKYCGDDA